MSVKDDLMRASMAALDSVNLYKAALGTIAELEDALAYCKDKVSAGVACGDLPGDAGLPMVYRIQKAAASSPYGFYSVTVEQANDLVREVENLRQYRDRLQKQIDTAVVAQEDYARRCSRDAFLDGANWLEHRLRDKPLSAYYTRMAWEEACKRWGEEGRDGQGA